MWKHKHNVKAKRKLFVLTALAQSFTKTKMDLFEVTTAELSAISDANRKILFFSGLKIIEDGLDFAKVAVMESFLTNLIDNESW